MSFSRRFVLYLLPNLWKILVGFIAIPLTTYKLDPADFGLFAMVMSFFTCGTGIAAMGASVLVSAHLPVAEPQEARRLISTMLVAGLSVGAIVTALLLAGWPLLVAWLPAVGAAGNAAVRLGAAALMLGIPWTYAIAVISVTGRARAFALVNVLEGTAGTAATLIALYGFDWRGLSLFFGVFCAAAVSAAGSLAVLAPYLGRQLSRRWFGEILRLAPTAVCGALLERGQSIVERFMLALYVGAAEVGILTHSQQYQTIARTGINALTHSAWPVSLEEARRDDGRFEKTGLIWAPAQVLIAAAAIFMATLGRDFISLLTHDKFTGAFFPATVWMCLLLVENSAKAAGAVVYARGLGVAIQRAAITGSLGALILTVTLVPVAGLYGIAAAAFGQVLLYRGNMILLARRHAVLPMQDGVLLRAVPIVAGCLAATLSLDTGLAGRSGLCGAGLGLLVLSCRAPIRMAGDILITKLRAAVARS